MDRSIAMLVVGIDRYGFFRADTDIFSSTVTDTAVARSIYIIKMTQ